MSRLITASLIGSIRWYNDCFKVQKEKAYNDLKNQLARIYTEPMSPAIKLGIKFEEAICKEALNPTGGGTHTFQEFVADCKGGEFQKVTKQTMLVDGEEYCLYGKIDVYFPELIIDIKSTSNFKGDDSYLKSYQHRIYCLNEGIRQFKYIVGVFDRNERLVDRRIVNYRVTDFDELSNDIESEIRRTISFLRAHKELMELYLTKFCKH